ncbi:DUF6010 family protein [Flavihumibacter fluvii]|uniref:DUF6010 family protein n=1 Tax=Flavihumibacter fluvii TaxID=2838157 RepID=UPI001BDF4490|nr:DUF6010 family protein [Flavihumibacter fluvii]ULQ51940.1 DUF6010 family protein [Flavihumibacter fluvii]
MIAAIIGVSSAVIIIFLFVLFGQFDKRTVYGLILSGIGFLYVGFVWTDIPSVVINAIQAIVFLFIAYYGVKKSIYLLGLGYFLHGCWDIVYPFFRDPGLIPPQYDLFCSTLDFVLCMYIIAFKKHLIHN